MTDVRLEKLPFDYDGKTFQLVCNNNVLADVQKEYGGELAVALNGSGTLESVLVFLAAMMNDYADEQGWPERYKSKQVGRAIKPARFKEVSPDIMKLVMDSLRGDDDEKN